MVGSLRRKENFRDAGVEVGVAPLACEPVLPLASHSFRIFEALPDVVCKVGAFDDAVDVGQAVGVAVVGEEPVDVGAPELAIGGEVGGVLEWIGDGRGPGVPVPRRVVAALLGTLQPEDLLGIGDGERERQRKTASTRVV